MSRILYTVNNIAEEIRYQQDENNRDSLSTEFDILPSMNRAQDYAFDIIARMYPEPLLKYGTIPLLSNVQEYSFPEDCFEDRLQKVEVYIPTGNGAGSYREIKRISYRDVTEFESSTRTNLPVYYCVIGRKIRFIPLPTGTYGVRVWYLKSPERLVMPQGRITVSNTTSNYIILDQAGDDLSTEVDQLGSYVNIIDGQTGDIKKTLQIQSLFENKVTFRSTPIRSTVLNRIVSGSFLPSEIELDDYICAIDGTCVPYYGRPISNFIIQYAVSEVARKLGGQAELEEKILEKFEKQIEKTWVGRESTLKIKKKSSKWGTNLRRMQFE